MDYVKEMKNADGRLKQGLWDKYFMTMARTAGTNSKCLSRQIGAILVRGKSIISTGYNGPPAGIAPCWDRNPNNEPVCPRYLQGYKSGQGLHLCIAGHAERNAIILAGKNGIATEGSILYCDCGVPCTPCIIEIINAGVVEVVWNPKGSPTGKDGTPYYDETAEYLVKNTTVKFRPFDMP
jgi:dCMP deaminase